MLIDYNGCDKHPNKEIDADQRWVLHERGMCFYH